MSTFFSVRIQGIIAIVIASILWGTTGTIATFAPEVSAMAIGAVAMGGGGLLQGLLALKGIKQNRLTLAKHWHYLVYGAIMVAIYPLVFYGSMRLAGVTVGTVISIGSAPLFSALLEFFLEKILVSKRWLLGAIIGLFGITLLCFSESSNTVGTTDTTNIIWGTLLGLLAGFSYAAYSWTARQMMNKGIASHIAMGATFGLGAILLIPVLLITGAPLITSWNNAMVGLYMALIPMFLGYVCFGFGLARVAASMATTITLLEPIVAAILAVIIVGEKLTDIGWIGTLLVFICLIFITLPGKKLS